MLSKAKKLAIKKWQGGFSLIESLIAIAIFVMMVSVVYQTFFSLNKQALTNWENTTVGSLASQYLEVARNMPYSQIGTIAGSPHGALPDLPNAAVKTVGTTTYQIYFEVTYIDDPADGTLALDTDRFAYTDYKQVKLTVKNTLTGNIKNFVTNIVPTGLEGIASGGALLLSVINAVGQPVPNATIKITNTVLSPSINLERTSGADGKLIEVGLPSSANSYHVTVEKTGYSKDQTYPSSAGNPDPTKPDSTVVTGTVTQISFGIDQTSNLTFNTLNQTCQVVPSVLLGIRGTKLIGTPSVYKYDNVFTSDASGQVVLSNAEWDNYTPAVGGSTHMIYGSSPIQQINLLPNTTQTFNMILGPKTTHSLLVIVKDPGTGNPIEGASVQLTNASIPTDVTKITGGSLWSQKFWNGGSGQSNWTDATKYYSDDGNIVTNDTPFAMRLINDGVNTLSTFGSLISSSFDTGSSETIFTTLNWQPTSQDPAAEVKFQIAANNDNSTWDFTGPDGTSSTYYTTPGTTISTDNNDKRYVKYKAFLSTTDTTKNPTITSVDINYVSGCFTPGQVIFPGLVTDTPYDVTVRMPGYTTQMINVAEVENYQVLEVPLTTD